MQCRSAEAMASERARPLALHPGTPAGYAISSRDASRGKRSYVEADNFLAPIERAATVRAAGLVTP